MANLGRIVKPMWGAYLSRTIVTRLIVLTLLAVIGWGLIASPGLIVATPNLQTQCVTLALQPPSRTVNIGDIFTFDVRLDAGNASFDTVSLDVRFDPGTLVVVDASGNPSSSIQQGNLNNTGSTTVLQNSVDNTAGTIAYTEALLGYSQTGGIFTVATVRFKAKQATSGTSVTFANIGNTASPTFTGILLAGSTVAFCTGSPAGATVIVSSPTTGTPTSTPTRTRTPTPTSTPITGWRRVYLPLILKNYSPGPLPPCGWNDPDDDEPGNDLWNSPNVLYGSGLFHHRTFWSLTRPEGQKGNDLGWFKWKVEWTGYHWLWTQNLDPSNLRIWLLVYRATGNPANPLECLASGESYGPGQLKVQLERGQTYFVLVSQPASPSVGCYSLYLEP